MSARKNVRSDGINTMADLLGRCRLDHETGCMVVNAPKRRGTFYVWLPAVGKPVTLPTALAHLLGQPPEPGQRWVPICGNTGCCSLDHRFIGTRADLMLIMRPQLDPLHRARIATARRSLKTSRYTPELRAEIMASDESNVALGARIGLHFSQVWRIRRGEAWREAAPASSVFNLGASS